jgi:hypothetical protein
MLLFNLNYEAKKCLLHQGRFKGSANYVCVEASMPNVDGCILSAYQSCRIGLEGLKVHSSEIDRMLLDKFTELVSNN